MKTSLLSSASRFFCENFWLEKHVRYVVVIYPVVILWLLGTLSYSNSPDSPVCIFVGQCLTPMRHFHHFIRAISVLLIYTMCFAFHPRRSFDSGSVLHDAGDTRRPAHVAAPQAAALQHRRAQSVAGGDCFDSKQVPPVNFNSTLSLSYDCLGFFFILAFHLPIFLYRNQTHWLFFLKLLINV